MSATCQACGEPVRAKRSTRRFCSERCKKRLQRTARACPAKGAPSHPLSGTSRPAPPPPQAVEPWGVRGDAGGAGCRSILLATDTASAIRSTATTPSAWHGPGALAGGPRRALTGGHPGMPDQHEGRKGLFRRREVQWSSLKNFISAHNAAQDSARILDEWQHIAQRLRHGPRGRERAVALADLAEQLINRITWARDCIARGDARGACVAGCKGCQAYPYDPQGLHARGVRGVVETLFVSGSPLSSRHNATSHGNRGFRGQTIRHKRICCGGSKPAKSHGHGHLWRCGG
jgi:hypothetical protein